MSFYRIASKGLLALAISFLLPAAAQAQPVFSVAWDGIGLSQGEIQSQPSRIWHHVGPMIPYWWDWLTSLVPQVLRLLSKRYAFLMRLNLLTNV